MKKNVRLTLLGLSLGVAFLAGCELIVDFDRTLIPAEATDAATPPPRDATADTDVPDGASTDGSLEAGDAQADGTAPDASDGGSDADLDASNDAADGE